MNIFDAKRRLALRIEQHNTAFCEVVKGFTDGKEKICMGFARYVSRLVDLSKPCDNPKYFSYMGVIYLSNDVICRRINIGKQSIHKYNRLLKKLNLLSISKSCTEKRLNLKKILMLTKAAVDLDYQHSQNALHKALKLRMTNTYLSFDDDSADTELVSDDGKNHQKNINNSNSLIIH